MRGHQCNMDPVHSSTTWQYHCTIHCCCPELTWQLLWMHRYVASEVVRHPEMQTLNTWHNNHKTATEVITVATKNMHAIVLKQTQNVYLISPWPAGSTFTCLFNDVHSVSCNNTVVTLTRPLMANLCYSILVQYHIQTRLKIYVHCTSTIS